MRRCPGRRQMAFWKGRVRGVEHRESSMICARRRAAARRRADRRARSGPGGSAWRRRGARGQRSWGCRRAIVSSQLQRSRWNEAAGAAPAESIMAERTKKKSPVERRVSAAPVKRRSPPGASVACAEACREPGSVERSTANKRSSISVSESDLPGSTSSSSSESASCVEERRGWSTRS